MSRSPPVVSVVTVVFNGRTHVAETIASVLAQEGVTFEYWVIDGGSSDGTQDIIRAHAGRLAGWVSEPDGGIAEAFNKGLARVRGDYVMFLNADDALAHPRALANLVSAAGAAGLPDVVYGDCELIDPANGELMERTIVVYDRNKFLARETIPHPGMLMHKRYFKRYGIFDTSFKVAMDYELFLRGVPETGAVRVPGVVTRVRAGGVSARSRQLVIDESIRALRMHGHISRLAEARVRGAYALRGAVRRILESMGLYKTFRVYRAAWRARGLAR